MNNSNLFPDNYECKWGAYFESQLMTECSDNVSHYTSEKDIMEIVRPTICNYWYEKIDKAVTLSDFIKLKIELLNYKVLDPACGSGNFLVIAYRELKRIELVINGKIVELSS